MLLVTPAECEDHETVDYRNTDAGLRRVTNYFGGDPRSDLGDHPSAFLVQFRPAPGKDIEPHFHKVAQFQIIVVGDGAIGDEPAPAISFHYADPLTPYGPIRALDGEAGIDFLTLRPIARPGVFWMATSSDQLDAPPGREITAGVPRTGGPPQSGQEVHTLIEPHDDGLGGWFVRLGPGEQHRSVVDPRSSGQYRLVAAGALVRDEGLAPAGSLLFAHPDEEVTCSAGPDGAEVLVVQFPAPAEPAR